MSFQELRRIRKSRSAHGAPSVRIKHLGEEVPLQNMSRSPSHSTRSDEFGGTDGGVIRYGVELHGDETVDAFGGDPDKLERKKKYDKMRNTLDRRVTEQDIFQWRGIIAVDSIPVKQRQRAYSASQALMDDMATIRIPLPPPQGTKSMHRRTTIKLNAILGEAQAVAVYQAKALSKGEYRKEGTPQAMSHLSELEKYSKNLPPKVCLLEPVCQDDEPIQLVEEGKKVSSH